MPNGSATRRQRLRGVVIGTGVIGACVGWNPIRQVPSVPGYYEAVSHSGITLGAVIGRLLASETATGRRPGLLADFRPERFGAPD